MLVQNPFLNVRGSMYKYVSYHGENAMILLNNGNNLLINYDFREKNESKELLYVICDRKSKYDHKYRASLSTGVYGSFLLCNDFVWKMRSELFKWDATNKSMTCMGGIKLPFKVLNVPMPIEKCSALIHKWQMKKNRMKLLFKDQKITDPLIGAKRKYNVPWTRRDKMVINGNNTKNPSISAKLEKHEWIQILKKNVLNPDLVPILNPKTLLIETAWIIEMCTLGKTAQRHITEARKKNVNVYHVAVSVDIFQEYNNNNVADECLIATEIYLDIHDAHKLVPYAHCCNCLDTFRYIDYLEIGNEHNRMKHKAFPSGKRNRTVKTKLTTIHRCDILNVTKPIMIEEEKKTELEDDDTVLIGMTAGNTSSIVIHDEDSNDNDLHNNTISNADISTQHAYTNLLSQKCNEKKSQNCETSTLLNEINGLWDYISCLEAQCQNNMNEIHTLKYERENTMQFWTNGCGEMQKCIAKFKQMTNNYNQAINELNALRN